MTDTATGKATVKHYAIVDDIGAVGNEISVEREASSFYHTHKPKEEEKPDEDKPEEKPPERARI